MYDHNLFFSHLEVNNENFFHSHSWRCVFVFLVAMSLLLFPAPNADTAVRIEGMELIPVYSQINDGLIFHTDELAVIVFYRPPECIPTDFNLFDYFDLPRVYECMPVTIDGFSIWENGPGIDLAPIQFKIHGLGAVPVWFVGWPELQDAIADDILTISELAGMSSLITGLASFYTEVDKNYTPLGSGYLLEFVAKGLLEDGRSFKAAVTHTGFVAPQVGIDFN